MTGRAGMFAQMTDIQNDRLHKGYIKVTLHVPEEAGNQLKETFPWPTYTNPVPVVLAHHNPDPGQAIAPAREAENPPPLVPSASRSLPQHIGMLCNNGRFQAFLKDAIPHEWQKEEPNCIFPDKIAAEVVRNFCGVASRKHIPGTPAEIKWDELEFSYQAWMRWPEIVG